MNAEDLAKLSAALDHVLDQPEGERPEALRRLGLDAQASPLDKPPTFALASEDALHTPGEPVGPYRLLQLLGRGGMGEVWLAERSGLGDDGPRRRVALKLPVMPGALSSAHHRELVLQRFERERDILAALTHPHIARLYDAGVDEHGQPYLALEHVQGMPITEHARRERLPLSARIGLLLQVAEAVSHAHGQLVLHRDLKPSNILVTPQGQVRLLDFGIAKLLDADNAGVSSSPTPSATLTRVAGRALTPDYASPEQIRGEALGTASDLYSLAVVAYELFTGVRPYRLLRGSAAELEEAILQADPTAPSSVAVATPRSGEDGNAAAQLRQALRGDLDAIVLQALRKDPAHRYGTVEAFAADLRRHLRGEPVLARKLTRRYLLTRFIARHRAAVALSGVALAVLLLASGLVAWQAHQARLEALRANQEAVQAQAVQKFLLELLQLNSTEQADPQAMQRTTVRQMLDIGAARIDELLKDAPQSQLAIMRTLADLYIQLGERKAALDLRRRRLDLARRILSNDDPRLARAMLDVGFHLYDGPAHAEAGQLLREAEQVLARAGDAGAGERGAWLTQSVRFQRYESLAGYLHAADAVVRFFQPHRGNETETAQVRSRYFAAQAHAMAADWAGAVAMLTEARAIAERHGGGSLLVMAVADMGELQFGRGDLAAAEQGYREAAAAGQRVYGASHRTALIMRVKLAAFLYLTGRADEAQRIEADVQERIAQAGERLEDWWRSYIETLTTAALAERGRPDRALIPVRAAVSTLQRDLPGTGPLAWRRLELAELLTTTGELGEAERELDQAEQEWRAYAGEAAKPAAAQRFQLARAAWQLARGEPAAALALLESLPVDAGDGKVWNQVLVRRELLRGQALLLAHELPAALAAARSALAAATSVSPNRPHGEAQARLLLARVLLEHGDRSGAQAQLGHALALRERHDAQGSRELALLRAALRDLSRLESTPRSASPWSSAGHGR